MDLHIVLCTVFGVVFGQRRSSSILVEHLNTVLHEYLIIFWFMSRPTNKKQLKWAHQTYRSKYRHLYRSTIAVHPNLLFIVLWLGAQFVLATVVLVFSLVTADVVLPYILLMMGYY